MAALYTSVAFVLASLTAASYGHKLIGRQGAEASLSFTPIQGLATCESTLIQWAYFGRQAPMTLIVSNEGVPPSSTTATPGPVEKILSTSITPFSQGFNWTQIDVPAGAYRLIAVIPDLNVVAESEDFEVRQGPDVSCLPPTSSASNSAASSTLAPSSSDPSSNTSTPTAGTSATSSSAPSETALPGSSLPTRTNTGTIVGVVLGVVGLGIIFLGVFFFLRRKKASKSAHRHTKSAGRWNGLGSTDSRTILANSATTNAEGSRSRQSLSGQRRNHFHGESMASMQLTSESGGTKEEKYSASRKNSAATTYDDHEGMVLHALPTLHRQPSGRDVVPSGRRPSYPDTTVFPEQRSRRNSRSQQSTPFPDASISRSSSSAATSAPYHIASTEPTPEAKKANRNSIGAGNARKRKPVPAYNPSELPVASTTSPSPTPVYSSPTASTALDHEGSHDPSQRGGTPLASSATQAVGHYTTRNLNSGPVTPDGGEALAHKSSFGPTGAAEGKPLHYLMPDLPPDIRSKGRR